MVLPTMNYLRSLLLGLLTILAVALPVQAGERIVIVAEDDWYPYSAQRSGQAEGLAVDIVRAAFSAVGVTVDFKTMPYARCMQMVKQGVELGCFDTLRDVSTRDTYLFHEQPLFKATIGIYAPATASGSMTAQQLVGHSVALTNGYTYGDTVEKNPDIRKDMAPNDLLTLRKLQAGRTEFALVYTRVADWLQHQHPELRGGFRQVGTLLEDGLYLSFSKSRSEAPEMVKLLNRGLAQIRGNGTYARIEADWQQRLAPTTDKRKQ